MLGTPGKGLSTGAHINATNDEQLALGGPEVVTPRVPEYETLRRELLYALLVGSGNA